MTLSTGRGIGHDPDMRTAGRDIKKRIKLIGIIVLAVVAAVIVFQNTAPVETKLLFASVRMPRAALLFICMVIGFAMGVMVSLQLTRRR